MTLKYSASCNTESECDCEYWEEIVTCDNKGFFDSDSESDLCNSFHPNSPCSSFEKERRKSKLSETVLIPEKNQAKFINCCKDCPLLQAQQLENTRHCQAELFPESVPHFECKNYPISEHPSKPCTSKTFSTRCNGSYRDHLCLNSHLIITEKLVKEPNFYSVTEDYAFDNTCQKQPLPDCPLLSKQNKAVQVSFPCREAEVEGHSFCECFEQSAIPVVNKTPVGTSVTFHSIESICSKKTSSQLIKEHLDSSSELSDKIGSPQAAEPYARLGRIVISLTVEAGSINPSSSLAVDVGPSKARVNKKDSEKHVKTLEDPEHNHLLKKLCFSIIPSSVCLDTESPKQTPSFTNEIGLPQIPIEAIQSLATHAESSESSILDCHTDQVPSTLKPWFCRLFSSSSEHTHATHSSYLFIRSFPYHKDTPTYRTSEKHQLKDSRPKKSVVFTKHKVRKNHKHRNKHISSKCNCTRTLDVEPTHQYTTSQAVNVSEINELYFVPLKRTTGCHCSPLLDLTVDLYSEGKSSDVEKFLSAKREPLKQTRVCKATPRFSFQYILKGRSFENFQFISPIRKKNSLKMQNILNSCLGRAGEQNKQESCNCEVYSLNSSNTRGNQLYTPHSPTDRKSSTAPLLLSSKNNSVPASHVPPFLNDRNDLPDSFLKTERNTWTPASLNPDCKYGDSCSPYCANIVNIRQQPKERNMVNTILLGELDFEAVQMLVSKKFSVCPCGNVPQCGLFPTGDIPWSVRKKIRTSSDISQKASMTESNKVKYPRRTFDTAETCCTNYHHLPTCSLHNVSRPETTRNQFTKTQFCFPMKNLKDVEEKSKAVKTDEREHVIIPKGPDTLHDIYPSGVRTASHTNSYRMPEYFVYQPECCSSCQTAVKQHLEASRKLHSDLTSKNKVLENCLDRENVFLANCGQEAKSQCKCSQEIPLFYTYQTDTSNGNRTAFSKRGT